MIPGQWFINEVREKLERMEQRIEGLVKEKVEVGPTVIDGEKFNERLTKLEGELKALKARMGKKRDE